MRRVIEHTQQDLPPNLFEFLDVRQYLLQYLEWRKALDPEFSYSQWAEELGFQSRSFLRLLLVGKRSITENSVQLFCKGLRLGRKASEYFALLVRYQHAVTLEQREACVREMSQLAREAGRPGRIHDTFEFLSSYLIPRLQVLLTLDGFDRSLSQLAIYLRTTEAHTRELLNTLQGMGLAESFEVTHDPKSKTETQWRATHRHVSLDDRAVNVAIQSFHRKSLEEAVSALSLPVDQRCFQSLTLTLDRQQYTDLCDDLQATIDRWIQKFTGETASGSTLYQVNLNAIPVSPPLLHESARAPGGFVSESPFLLEETCHETH